MIRRSGLVATLFAALCFTSAVADTPCTAIEGGVVLDFVGDARSYRLQREGRQASWGPFAELTAGDRLEVLSTNGAVRIHSGGGPDRTYRRSDGALCVGRPGAPSWMENSIRILGERIGRRSSASGRSLVTRSEALALALPDLADGSALIRSGSRMLTLPWRGGAAPYALIITGPDGSVLVEERDLNSRRLRLRDARELLPGDYRVRVSDAHGVIAEGGFRAEVRDGAPVRDIATLIDGVASVIAATDRRRFDLYLEVAAHARESSVSSELMSLLEGE